MLQTSAGYNGGNAILKPLFIFLSISVKHKVLVYCTYKCLKSFTDCCQICKG